MSDTDDDREYVRLLTTRHRRVNPETGERETFEAGDVFAATPQEREAFGDTFEPVDADGEGEFSPTHPTAGADEYEAGEYRLTNGRHRYTDADGNAVVAEVGDIVPLTAQEVEAFADKFDAVEDDDTEAADVELAAEPPFDPGEYTVSELRDELAENDYDEASLDALDTAEAEGENRDTAREAIDAAREG